MIVWVKVRPPHEWNCPVLMPELGRNPAPLTGLSVQINSNITRQFGPCRAFGLTPESHREWCRRLGADDDEYAEHIRRAPHPHYVCEHQIEIGD